MQDYADYDAMGLAELVRRREVAPGELVEAAIDRIEAHNGVLNAVVYKAYDAARAAAAAPASPDAPFAGVPFLVKDLGLKVQGWPRTSGSRFVEVAADDEDSVMVKRFRDAGLVLLGKTNTPEFGIPGATFSARLGACRNPWNPDHISGGSSGGAASGTASGMVPMAHASDGLGSIRIPAACCGLVGMKTTRDRNPTGQDVDQAFGLVVDHVVSRSVRDSAALLDATGYPEPETPFPAPPKAGPYLDEVGRRPGRLRIAWSSATPRGVAIHPEIQAALERTIELLRRLGHEVFERPLDIDYRLFYRAQRFVSAANFAAGMKRWIERIGREPGEDEIEPLARRAYEGGLRVPGERVMWGLQTLRLINRRLLAGFQDIDVHLSPVMGTPVPRVEQLEALTTPLEAFDARQAETFPFTPPFNVSGQPSLSLPLEVDGAGLPVGMMFTGRYADEATLYRLAGQLETEAPWRGRRPKVWSLG